MWNIFKQNSNNLPKYGEWGVQSSKRLRNKSSLEQIIYPNFISKEKMCWLRVLANCVSRENKKQYWKSKGFSSLLPVLHDLWCRLLVSCKQAVICQIIILILVRNPNVNWLMFTHVSSPTKNQYLNHSSLVQKWLWSLDSSGSRTVRICTVSQQILIVCLLAVVDGLSFCSSSIQNTF